MVARTSAFQFKGKTTSAHEIGRTLHVQTVLEGTVQQYGDSLRVTAELDETSSGYTVWSKSFDRKFSDVLGVQREISSAIAKALASSFSANKMTLSSEFSSKAANIDPEAYQAWLKGLYFFNMHTDTSLHMAIQYFEESSAKDPAYAPSWLGIARSYTVLPVVTAEVPVKEVIARIRAAAGKPSHWILRKGEHTWHWPKHLSLTPIGHRPKGRSGKDWLSIPAMLPRSRHTAVTL